MYNEKVKVAKIKTIIARMKNGVYENQRELMQEVLKVLCTHKDQMIGSNWNKDYNHSFTTFEDNTSLLNAVGLERKNWSIEKADGVI